MHFSLLLCPLVLPGPPKNQTTVITSGSASGFEESHFYRETLGVTRKGPGIDVFWTFTTHTPVGTLAWHTHPTL